MQMENYWVAPAAVALALTGMVSIAWRFRAHAVKQKQRLAALDAYAEREIAQQQRQ
jgi:hypothetical protein